MSASCAGTTADEDGNITMEQKRFFSKCCRRHRPPSVAAPGDRAGQAQWQARTLPPKASRFRASWSIWSWSNRPWQTYEVEYSPSYAGELRMPLSTSGVAARRPRRSCPPCCLELFSRPICISARVFRRNRQVGAEEGILDEVCFTNEQAWSAARPRPAAMPARPAIIPHRRPTLSVRLL